MSRALRLPKQNAAIYVICPWSLSPSPKHPSVIHGLKAARPFNTLLSTMALPVIDDLLKTAGLCYSDFFSATRNIGDLYTIKDLACSGQGIAILPETLVGEDLDSGKLKRIPEPESLFRLKNIHPHAPFAYCNFRPGQEFYRPCLRVS